MMSEKAKTVNPARSITLRNKGLCGMTALSATHAGKRYDMIETRVQIVPRKSQSYGGKCHRKRLHEGVEWATKGRNQ